MKCFFLASALAMGLAMIPSFYRLVKGPTHFDRLIGLGLIDTKTVVMLVLIGLLFHQTDLLVDLSLTYALIAFIGTLALAKFFETGGKA